jgi:uncharacterized protein (TIGR03000 family)
MFRRRLSVLAVGGITAAVLLVSARSSEARVFRRGRVGYAVRVVPFGVYYYGYVPRYYVGFPVAYPVNYGAYYPYSYYGGSYAPYPYRGADYPGYSQQSYYANPAPVVETQPAPAAQDNYQSARPPASYNPPAPVATSPPETDNPPAPAANRDVALVTVDLPDANAQLWFQDKPTGGRGVVREFESPPLVPGQAYVYHLRVRWAQDGGYVEEKRDVSVQAGDRLTVDFRATSPAEANRPPAPPANEVAPPPQEQQLPRSDYPVP